MFNKIKKLAISRGFEETKFGGVYNACRWWVRVIGVIRSCLLKP